LRHHHHHLHHLHLLHVGVVGGTVLASSSSYSTFWMSVCTVLSSAFEAEFAVYFRMEVETLLTIAACWEVLALLGGMHERTVLFDAVGEVLASLFGTFGLSGDWCWWGTLLDISTNYVCIPNHIDVLFLQLDSFLSIFGLFYDDLWSRTVNVIAVSWSGRIHPTFLLLIEPPHPFHSVILGRKEINFAFVITVMGVVMVVGVRWLLVMVVGIGWFLVVVVEGWFLVVVVEGWLLMVVGVGWFLVVVVEGWLLMMVVLVMVVVWPMMSDC
jgi:hypothetical protein